MDDPQLETEEETIGIADHVFDEIRDLIDMGAADRLNTVLEPLHPADIADLLEQISPRERNKLIDLWPDGIDGETLSELEEGIREEVIELLNPVELAEAVKDLESDDVVDLVEYLDDEQQEAVLEALDQTDRVVVEKALAYPEESAGRHMQVEVVHVPQDWTVGQTIDYLRSDAALPDQFYHVILVDARIKPVAYVTLGRVLSSKRDEQLINLSEDSFRSFHIADAAADVAYVFNQYHIISAPVVDDDDRLVGVITIDDAMILLDEQHEEDIMRLAGVGESSLSDSVIDTTRQRMPWLAVNLITSILASLVIAVFEDVISGIVALAVLMPIVASMGGNAGTQSLTVAVRAIATRDLSGSNIWRVLRREMMVGVLNGIFFAVVMGVVGYIWFGTAMLGIVLALAMVINLVVAGLAGTVVPFILERLKIDPALASGAFVTTVTDVVGFFAFLGLATVILL